MFIPVIMLTARHDDERTRRPGLLWGTTAGEDD